MSHSLQAFSLPPGSSSPPTSHQGSTPLSPPNDVKVHLDRCCTHTERRTGDPGDSPNHFRENLLSLDGVNVDPEKMSHSLQASSSPLASSSFPISHQGSTLPPPRLSSSTDVKASLDRCHCTNTESTNRFRENLPLLDEVSVNPEEDKHDQIFARHTVDMVYSSYAAARTRLRLYVHLTDTLQREVDEWAQKVERAGIIVPDYKPVGWLELATSGSAQ